MFRRNYFYASYLFIICPITIAYSMGQIIKSFCICQCVCVCLSASTDGCVIFTKIGTDERNPKRKNEFIRGSISHHPLPNFPPQLPF